MTIARPHASPLRCIVLALACLLALPAGRALAQGTNGMVPDPISSTELAEYAERLGLSDRQWASIEGFYERYRNDFKALRDTEIQAYLGSTTGLWMRGMRGLDSEAIEDNLEALERIHSRIQSIDGQFFEQLQAVLSEEQVAELPAVMQSRQRQRHASGASRMVGRANRGAGVDLSDLYRRLELTDEERTETEPYVVQYEAALTRATQKLFDRATRVFVEVAERVEAAGINPADMGDPDRRREMMASMGQIWNEANQAPREQANEIAALNAKTVRQLTELLGLEAGDDLRARYLRAAYPEVPARTSASRSFREALALEDLPEPVRRDVQNAADLHRIQRHGVIDEMVSYLDEYRADWSFNRWDREAREAHDEKLDKFRDRLRTTDQAAMEGLVATLGPEFSGRIDVAVASARTDDDDERGDRSGRRDRDRQRERRPEAFGPDPFVPQAMGRRTAVAYSDSLGLSDNDAYIVESLYEDYLASLRHLQANEIAKLDELRRAQRDVDEDERNPEQIAELFELRRRAVSAIVELDRVLFDDIETILADDEQRAALERIRMGRERQVYAHVLDATSPAAGVGGDRRGFQGQGRGRFRGGFAGPRSNESIVDIAAVVSEVSLPDELADRADRVLVDYEKRVTEEFRKQYEAALELRSQTEQARTGWRRDDNDEDRRARWEQMREAMERLGERSREVRKPVADINHETLAVLSEALPGDAMTSIRRAYNRKAYPGVYRDEDSAQRYLDRARELPNISEDQLQRIGRIEAEFLPAYDAVCDKMVQLNADAPQMDWGDRDSWRVMMEQRNKLESLEFDRDEVSAKALRQLREALNEQQIELLDLPEQGE